MDPTWSISVMALRSVIGLPPTIAPLYRGRARRCVPGTIDM